MMMQSWCCGFETGKTGMGYKSEKPAGANPTGLNSVHGAEPARRLTCLAYHLVNSKQQEIYDGNPNFKAAARAR